MFGNSPNLELTNIWNNNDLLDCDVLKPDNLDRFQRTVLNLKKYFSANRKRAVYSEKECQHPFKVGSLVYVKTHWLSNKAEKFQAKMANRFCGPYRIIYKLTEVTFIVQDVMDEREEQVADVLLKQSRSTTRSLRLPDFTGQLVIGEAAPQPLANHIPPRWLPNGERVHLDTYWTLGNPTNSPLDYGPRPPRIAKYQTLLFKSVNGEGTYCI
ncbi:hypothetical protein J6590_058905 [Homalodisca vitripennis]|nr:hypothetical protein J6590_058905 [Homalodisca vitripennis]